MNYKDLLLFTKLKVCNFDNLNKDDNFLILKMINLTIKVNFYPKKKEEGVGLGGGGRRCERGWREYTYLLR